MVVDLSCKKLNDNQTTVKVWFSYNHKTNGTEVYLSTISFTVIAVYVIP